MSSELFTLPLTVGTICDSLSGVDPKPFRHRFQTGSGPYSASFLLAKVAVIGHTAALA